MKIGELLVKKGLLTTAQIDEALAAQKIYGGKLGTNLVELGMLSDDSLADFLAQQLSLPRIQKQDLENIPSDVLDLVHRSIAEKYEMVPYRLDHRLHVALSDPSQLDALDQLQHRVGRAIAKAISPEIWVLAALERYYGVNRPARHFNVNEDHVDNDMLVTDIGSFDAEPPEIDQAVDVCSGDPGVTEPNFSDYIEQLAQATAPAQVMQVLFASLHAVFPQMSVFRCNKDVLTGWMLSGLPIHIKTFQAFSVSLGRSDQTLHNLELGQPCLGQATTLLPEKLWRFLEISDRQNIAMYPLFFRHELKILFIGVAKLGQPVPQPRRGLLVPEMLKRVSIALEILFLTKKLHVHPVEILGNS